MHPKIKKFWISKRDHDLSWSGPVMDIWSVFIGCGNIRKIETVCHGDKYRFNGEWYSEEEMLKIIKMKAFI